MSDDILLNNNNNNYLRIKKNNRYLFCIPLVSLLDFNKIYINTLNNNIKIYYFYLYNKFRNELRNSYYFTDSIAVYGGMVYYKINNKIDFIPNHTKELFEKSKKKADYINEFERLMEPIKRVLLKSNVKLSNRSRLLLFLLRHHAIPPKDIKEYDNIESILEH